MAGHFKFMYILLLAIFTSSISGQYLIASINCGESEVMTDENSITWSPDTTLVSNGLARTVHSIYSLSPVMDTLRVFTTRKKNCYSIGKKLLGVKVLVRANFYYGNYDRLASPPAFDLQFDGNNWVTVQSMISGPVYHEITYIPKRDYVSVCLAQTFSGMYPFITAIEVRKLDSEVYSEVDKNRALKLVRRYSFGATKSIRYPIDKYDRIWRSPDYEMDVLTNMASFIDTSDEPNNLPAEVYQHAMTVTSTRSSLYLDTYSFLDPPLYANMYFSEVTNLGSSSLTRSFRVTDSSIAFTTCSSYPITPPYGSVCKMTYNNYKVPYNTSSTDVYLYATAASDLPPIINAYELFYISDVLTDGTSIDDGLALLQTAFDQVLGEWSGDPCLPVSYSWDWITCSNDPAPRVTSLYLNGFNLSGSLPDISSMDALKIIDLHNNSLNGMIPSFLGNMPNLQQLNLADNNFSGSVPTSLSKNNKLKLTLTGNPLSCTSDNSCSSSPSSGGGGGGGGSGTSLPRKKKTSKLPLILGVYIPAAVLVFVAACCVFFVISRMNRIPANTSTPVNIAGGGENGNKGQPSNLYGYTPASNP